MVTLCFSFWFFGNNWFSFFLHLWSAFPLSNSTRIFGKSCRKGRFDSNFKFFLPTLAHIFCILMLVFNQGGRFSFVPDRWLWTSWLVLDRSLWNGLPAGFHMLEGFMKSVKQALDLLSGSVQNIQIFLVNVSWRAAAQNHATDTNKNKSKSLSHHTFTIGNIPCALLLCQGNELDLP